MKDLAAKGGVIQINYHVGFLSQEFRNAEKADPKINEAIAEEVTKRCGVEANEGCMLIEGDRITREYAVKGILPRVDYTKIIECHRSRRKSCGTRSRRFGFRFRWREYAVRHGRRRVHAAKDHRALLKKAIPMVT